jgi:outer membrane immunogenic protein
MRRLSTILIAIAAAGFAFAASAADMPAGYKPYYRGTPVFSWAGFYVGGNAGYSLGKHNVDVTSFDVGGATVPGLTPAVTEPKGFIGGIQAGYNWQTMSGVVYGVEADFQWSGQKDSATTTAALSMSPTPCFGNTGPCTLDGASTSTLDAKIDWLGTVRGRLGYTADQILLYGTGGLAYGNVKTSLTGAFSGTFTDSSGAGACDNSGAGCAIAGTAATAGSQIRLGWVLGAGIEGAVPTMRKLSWRVEYLYVDLGSATSTALVNATVDTIPSGDVATTAYSTAASHTSRITDNIVRMGLNYRF